MQHKTELAFSLLTIVLAILAIAIFIYYGAGVAFYIVVVLAIAIGFVNAWLVSKAVPESVTAASPAPKRENAQVRRGARR